MIHMKPYVAEEKEEAKKKGRKFRLKNAIDAAKKTYKKSKHHSTTKHKTQRRKLHYKGFFDGGKDSEGEESESDDELAPGKGESDADKALAQGGRRRKHRKHGRK